MNRLSMFAAPIFVSAALLCGACDSMPWSKDKKDDDQKHEAKEKASDKAQATAVATIRPSTAAATQPANQNVTGKLTFTQTSPQTVHVNGTIRGLAPNTKHGFHIHEKGDLSAPDLSSAGSHFNPSKAHHGGPPDGDAAHRHAGDLGNITADANGEAKIDLKLKGVSLNNENSIAGLSVLVHAKEDDLKTDPSGNSGGRVAGGVIEVQK